MVESQATAPQYSENTASVTEPVPMSTQTINSTVSRIYPMPGSSRKTKRGGHKILTTVVIIFLLLLAILGGIGFYTYSVAKQLQAQATDMEATGKTAYDDFKGQNLPATKAQLDLLQTDLKTIRGTYTKLALYNYLPIAHSYSHRQS